MADGDTKIKVVWLCCAAAAPRQQNAWVYIKDTHTHTLVFDSAKNKRADNNFMDIKLIRDCDLKENSSGVYIHDLYIKSLILIHILSEHTYILTTRTRMYAYVHMWLCITVRASTKYMNINASERACTRSY